MTARSPGAFLLSATFHAAIIGVIVFFAIMTRQPQPPSTHVLELVAGEGDNYGATVAPKLGSPNGVMLSLPHSVTAPVPQPVLPRPEPVAAPEPLPKPVITPAPVQPKPAPHPVRRAPSPVKAVRKAAPAVPNFKLAVQRKIWAADWRYKVALERERRRRRLEEIRREREARAAAAARAAAERKRAPHFKPIDAAGIANGVLGGSSANRIGGAGGKALTRQDGPLLDAYYSLLKERVQAALEKPPGLSDDLATTVVVHIAASGQLSNAHVVQSSGSAEFDQAVVTAFSHVEMPEHPEHRGEDVELTFRTKDANGD